MRNDIAMTCAKVQITILVDNRAGEGLAAEHGFSLWIETPDRRILLDTGQGGVLKDNARKLGVDLAKTDVLVLSHGHYDHTGGLAQVLTQGRDISVYCHSGAVVPRYSMKNGIAKPIQMPPESMAAIELLPSKQLHWVRRPVLLCETIGVTGHIPRETSFEDPGGPFYLDPEGKHADSIDDDLALWVCTDEGVIVCVGCAHAGLVNTLRHIRALNPGRRLRAVIGGFHLVNAGRDRLEQTVAALRLFELDRVVPCHCTGQSAVALLRDGLGERVIPGAAGMSYQF